MGELGWVDDMMRCGLTTWWGVGWWRCCLGNGRWDGTFTRFERRVMGHGIAWSPHCWIWLSW